MKQQLSRSFARLRTTFLSFTTGQKVVAVIGTAAVLLAAVMVFRWVATPNYAPLYSNLAAEDASAVVDELNAEGVPYQLTNGGATVMVPQSQVYDTRIALSGKGLPASSGGDGYSLLDGQGISTSEFQEQTDFKRAMEGELAKTIEAIDGVNTAIVHLALPPQKVFADEQDPPTASVLVDTSAGTTLDPQQVQGVVHLVAASIDGLQPENVTVTDGQGQVLSTSDGGALGASTRDQQVSEFEQKKTAQIQSVLDRIVGPGNSTVQVTADLDFDKSVSESTTYQNDPTQAPLSSSESSEQYAGPGGAGAANGVVGPDGQMDPLTTGGSNPSKYTKKQKTEDNAVDTVIEHRETAPGSVNSMHVAVAIDTASLQGRSTTDIQDLISAGNGISTKRGDTIQVTSLQFDRTADDAAAAELAAAAKAEKQAQMWRWARDAGIALAVIAALLLAWLRSRKRSKARENATTYIVEQLRTDAAERAALAAAAEAQKVPAVAALERADNAANEELRTELASLVEKQPEDVAALLRGWLVDR
ncbi:flagellar basal-body MS-ring/collar protein FliF [Nocardioides aquiterrae]|uniref:Flagellar M-ring protein n=1 Tax=Nocardioides aquiterrae TaxID=203799 RepID=A0ABN1UE31_9ACTN